jgi:hypothetical protein
VIVKSDLSEIHLLLGDKHETMTSCPKALTRRLEDSLRLHACLRLVGSGENSLRLHACLRLVGPGENNLRLHACWRLVGSVRKVSDYMLAIGWFW